MKRRVKSLGMCSVVALSLLFPIPSGGAQELPPLPEVPAELQPVMEILGPVASGKCADAQLVLVLGSAVVGADVKDLLGINLLGEATAPLFVACGLVASPSDGQYECLADDIARQAADTPTKMVAGLPAPVQLDYFAQVIKTTYEVRDLLPDGLLDEALLSLATETLSCKIDDASTEGPLAPPVTLTTNPPSTPPPATEPVAVGTTSDIPVTTSAPVRMDEIASPGISAAPPTAGNIPTTAGSGNIPTAEMVASVPLWPVARFRQPVVFMVPLLFLAAVAYVGWAMTRDLETSYPTEEK